MTLAARSRCSSRGARRIRTGPCLPRRRICCSIANASLIKLNQIGTVTETLRAMAICRDAGYRQFVSHRSGETEVHFIADLTVGTGSGHLKSGAPARRARRQVQPPHRDRGQFPGDPLRHALTDPCACLPPAVFLGGRPAAGCQSDRAEDVGEQDDREHVSHSIEYLAVPVRVPWRRTHSDLEFLPSP